MNKKKKFLFELESLCNIYNDYLDEHDNSKLDVYISNGIIKINLINEDAIVDEFELTFEDNEEDIYRYISMFIFKVLFTGKIIYSKDNMFFDDIDNKKRNITLYDDLLVNEFLIYCKDEYLDNNMKIRNKINRNNNGNNMNQRVELTKKLLKRV